MDNIDERISPPCENLDSFFFGFGIRALGDGEVWVTIRELGTPDATLNLEVRRADRLANRAVEGIRLTSLAPRLAPGGGGLPTELRDFIVENLYSSSATSQEAIVLLVGGMLFCTAVKMWDDLRRPHRGSDTQQVLFGRTLVVRYERMAWGEWVIILTGEAKAKDDPDHTFRTTLTWLRTRSDGSIKDDGEAHRNLMNFAQHTGHMDYVHLVRTILQHAPDYAR